MTEPYSKEKRDRIIAMRGAMFAIMVATEKMEAIYALGYAAAGATAALRRYRLSYLRGFRR